MMFFQKLINGFGGLVMALILAALIYSAGRMAFRKLTNNYEQRSSGKTGVLWSLAAAFVVGAAAVRVNSAFNFGSQVH